LGVKKMIKGLRTLAIVALMLCLYVFSVSALNDVIDTVEIDGFTLNQGNSDNTLMNIQRGESFEVKFFLNSSVDVKDVEITAFISGYEFNNLEPMSATTKIFDMSANVTYVKRLTLRVPTAVEHGDYLLRVIVSDRNSGTQVLNYRLRLSEPRTGFEIEDVIFSPGTTVEAGRALLTTVRVENKGSRDEKSVKVSVAIPALGISAADFIDRIKRNDSETSEEMYMRIPVCAEPGNYRAIIEVKYNSLREAVYGEAIITVTDGDGCEAKSKVQGPETLIAVGSTSQTLVAGEQGALYPLTISNNGANAKAYSIVVDGVSEFAEVQINPISSFVLNGGDSQAVFVYLKPLTDAVSGQHVFAITVKSGNEVLKQIPMTANVQGVEEKSSMGLTDALEIGLVVLIILLIILVVVVGIKKLKKDDNNSDDEDLEGKTYY
jgi:uncharacterized membrane protein